jgi:RNA polymerase sigma-70 factor (ECF subfamily)
MDTAIPSDLLGQARAGDRDAFDALLGPLIDPAFRLAHGLLHDRAGAEDAVQEAAVRAWRHLGNVRPGSDVRPWFLAIVANQCRSTLRSRWWSVRKVDHVVGTTRGIEDRVVIASDLRTAIRRLRHDHRVAIVLYFYLDLPAEEVAAITRVPLGTAKSRIHRAVAQLRPLLETREVL